jgi:hypothetical protein
MKAMRVGSDSSAGLDSSVASRCAGLSPGAPSEIAFGGNGIVFPAFQLPFVGKLS